ncbi:MAG: hypothetical protein V1809_07235 [Planctomycetota bacterium]
MTFSRIPILILLAFLAGCETLTYRMNDRDVDTTTPRGRYIAAYGGWQNAHRMFERSIETSSGRQQINAINPKAVDEAGKYQRKYFGKMKAEAPDAVDAKITIFQTRYDALFASVRGKQVNTNLIARDLDRLGREAKAALNPELVFPEPGETETVPVTTETKPVPPPTVTPAPATPTPTGTPAIPATGVVPPVTEPPPVTPAPAGTKPEPAKKPLVVTAWTADGKTEIRLNGEPCDNLEALEKKAAALLQGGAAPEAILEIDKGTAFPIIQAIHDALRKAGVTKMPLEIR